MNIFEHIDKKAVAGLGVAFVPIIGGFFYWFSVNKVEESSLTSLPASPLDHMLGRDLLVALATLKSTKLNTTVFDDPVFISLKDFGVKIAAQPVGRRNPFAPFVAPVSVKKKTGGSATAGASGSASGAQGASSGSGSSIPTDTALTIGGFEITTPPPSGQTGSLGIGVGSGGSGAPSNEPPPEEFDMNFSF